MYKLKYDSFILQYSCTWKGVIVEVLGEQFQCACEGEEVNLCPLLDTNMCGLS